MESRPLTQAGKQLLEEACLLDLDCDVVDAAAVAVVALALDGHVGRDGLGAVGEEDVLVRGRQIEEADDCEEDDARDQEPDGRENPGHRFRIRLAAPVGQRRPRVRPPSTGTTVPVTYDARSEARKQTTSATSRGRPKRRSGMTARSSARERSAYTSASRGVSIRPGAIELTVTPSGPTSRASVFAQPITPGRTEFESARL